MQTTSVPQSLSPEPELKDVAPVLRLTSAISFWVQLGLAAVCVLTLLFAITGRSFSGETGQSVGIGIFWAIGSLLALVFNIYGAFRCTRIGKRLLTLSPELSPKKEDIIRLLRVGLFVSLFGILLSLLGAGVSVGVLVAKIVSQPAGMAITDPNRVIQGLDVFSTVANVNGIAAHFVGTISSLWLLDQVHHH